MLRVSDNSPIDDEILSSSDNERHFRNLCIDVITFGEKAEIEDSLTSIRKVDRRIARTRKMLSDALIDISLDRGYANFSIKDLTDLANIGYATFYRHFKSKDELLASVLQVLYADLLKAINAAESPRAEAVAMYRHISANPRPYRLYVYLPETNEARKIIRGELAHLCLNRFEPLDESTVPTEVAINHLIQSNTELLRWYLDNLDEYSAEQVADIYVDMIVRVTASLSFAPRAEWLEKFPPRQRDDSQAIAEAPSTTS